MQAGFLLLWNGIHMKRLPQSRKTVRLPLLAGLIGVIHLGKPVKEVE